MINIAVIILLFAMFIGFGFMVYFIIQNSNKIKDIEEEDTDDEQKTVVQQRTVYVPYSGSYYYPQSLYKRPYNNPWRRGGRRRRHRKNK